MGKDALVCDCDVIHQDVVKLAQSGMPTDADLQALADLFKVLGDNTRARIISALDQHEMCVCDLAALLGMTKSAISHQLSSLRAANLVNHRREGKNVFYRLADNHIQAIFETGLDHIREKQ